MVLECIIVDGGSDGPQKYGTKFIGVLAVSCKLLTVDHHQGYHWFLEPGLGEHGCDIFCQVLAVKTVLC